MCLGLGNRNGISPAHGRKPPSLYDPEMPRRFAIHTEFITLGQLVKVLGFIGNGGEAKLFLADAVVSVNGEADNRRGRKIRPGDAVSINGEEIEVTDQS